MPPSPTASTYAQAEATHALLKVMTRITENPALNPAGRSPQELTVAVQSHTRSTHHQGDLWETQPNASSQRHQTVAAFLNRTALNVPATDFRGRPNILTPRFPRYHLTGKPGNMPDLEPTLTLIGADPRVQYTAGKKLHVNYNQAQGISKIKYGQLDLAAAAIVADPQGRLHPAIMTYFAEAVIIPGKGRKNGRPQGFYQTLPSPEPSPAADPEPSPRKLLERAEITAVYRALICIGDDAKTAQCRAERLTGTDLNRDKPNPELPLALVPLGTLTHLDHRTEQFAQGYLYGIASRYQENRHSWRPYLSMSSPGNGIAGFSRNHDENNQIANINERLSKLPPEYTRRLQNIARATNYPGTYTQWQYELTYDRCNGEIRPWFGAKVPRRIVNSIMANLPEYGSVTLALKTEPDPDRPWKHTAALPWDRPEDVSILRSNRMQYPPNTAGNPPQVVTEFSASHKPPQEFMRAPPPQPIAKSQDRISLENRIMASLRQDGYSISNAGLNKLCSLLQGKKGK